MLERAGDWWRNVSTVWSVLAVMVVVGGAHVALSRAVDLPDAGGRYELLLGVAYFVFGIFVAFAVENARSGLTRVNELLKAGDADLISISKLAEAFGTEVQHEVRASLDRHMQDQIDYRLADFERSTPSFLALFDLVRDLIPESPTQEIAYDHLLGVLVSAAERRKQLEALVRQRVTPVEWVTLLALFGCLWGLMLAANGGPVVSSVLGGVLVAALAGMLVVLHHLDDFRWQEANAIWMPLHHLFLALGLVPYYPRLVIDTGRFDPPSGSIRVADYPQPYPDMTDKAVTEIDHVHGRR